jgi:hypothetical protein
MILAATAHSATSCPVCRLKWRELYLGRAAKRGSDPIALGGHRMATILEFRNTVRSVAAQTLAGTLPPAEIVFFPGVRYERVTEDPAPKTTRKRRRDTLELED